MSHQAEVHEHHAADTVTGLSNRKMGFWLFLASECVFFATLIANYLANLGRDKPGLPGPEVFNLPMTTVSTFVLLMSSLLMALAVFSIQNGNIQRTRLFLAGTILFGLIFLGFQATEFTTFVTHDNLTLSGSIFGSAFYLLTGTHGTHVFVGVLWMLVLLIASFKDGFGKEKALNVEIVGLYWHFVDVVWIVIFTVVYLLSRV